jgi:hypothetical protein
MKLPARRQDRMLWLLAAFLCAAGVAKSAPELPEGDGRQEVEQICTSCHSLQPIISVRHTNAEWRAVVDNMASLGAQGTDDDFNAAVEYLSRHYGKSRLNWPLYGGGAGLVFGGALLGCYRRIRRRQKQESS